MILTFHHFYRVCFLCFATPSGRAVQGVGLWPLACWHYGFGSRWSHGCLSVVIVMYCQVEVSVLALSLAQRSPTEWGVTECDRGAAIMGRPWLTRGCCAMGSGDCLCFDLLSCMCVCVLFYFILLYCLFNYCLPVVTFFDVAKCGLVLNYY